MIAASALDVLNQAARWLDDGRRVALVTLVGIEGRHRAASARMVADDGRSIGSFSGGCIEAAIVAEARDALRAGAARVVRFGVGSPYIDVRLPCGGGST
jgi:xanthine dehydrogenase accessory factor